MPRWVCTVRAVRGIGYFFALASTCVSCSSSGVTVNGNTVSTAQVTYRFGEVPGAWRSITVEENDAAWFDNAADAVAHVDHTCERSQDAPLPALVNHLLIGFTARSTVSEETVPFDQREARHVVVNASLDGVARTIELYVMKKDGCVFDLGYIAPPERFEQGRAGFARFVAGFHVERSPLSVP